MYVVGVDLVKVYKNLIRLARGGTLCPLSGIYIRSFLYLCQKHIYMLSTQDPLQTQRHTYTESEGMNKRYPIFISDKMEFKKDILQETKKNTR